MGTSFILARIAARTGAALWRHRLAWLAASLSVGALSFYQLSYAGPTVGNVDCADTAMAAVTRVDDTAAHAAYACLGASMRNTSEDVFVAGLRQRETPRGQVTRIGDQRTRDGGRIVFYTVDLQASSVGYIVYLDPMGKVVRVE